MKMEKDRIPIKLGKKLRICDVVWSQADRLGPINSLSTNRQQSWGRGEERREGRGTNRRE